ncbi:MAG TPA: energy-coupling factor transporter transmembrane component T, partial [Solirubrobacterales bacterium]|nr:energy-coupling factor transporter transmembrane component T [Solirubrobacterales bacterium]
LPIGILMAMINPIASQLGVTVWIAGIELPLIGVFDITREAVVYGLITGLRIVAILAVCAVYVATVDPDELLRLMRRYSVRSAMTASLAVRAVPVLARDGMNMADARECRPGRKPGVAAVVRGMFARSLDRASDAALALETRGFELAKPVRLATAPWRAADWAVLSAAVAVFALAIAGRVVGAAPFTAYPLTVMGAETTDLVFAALLILMSVAPLVPVKRVVSR